MTHVWAVTKDQHRVTCLQKLLPALPVPHLREVFTHLAGLRPSAEVADVLAHTATLLPAPDWPRVPVVLQDWPAERALTCRLALYVRSRDMPDTSSRGAFRTITGAVARAGAGPRYQDNAPLRKDSASRP